MNEGRVPLKVVDENGNNSNPSTTAGKTTTSPSSSVLADKIRELLESQKGTLTSTDLDDAVCVIAEFRSKMMMTK